METNHHEERVVATLPTPEQVVDSKRDAISNEISLIADQTKEMVIQNQQQYEQAAQIGREIKRKAKMVKDLFAPIKEAANKAHKAACAQEKLMLDPLNEAEKRIKQQMSLYTAEQERKRREAEEAARLAAQQQAQQLLQQAVDAEESGDEQATETLLEEAQIMQEAPLVIETPALKVSGVSVRKDWEVELIDQDAVPVSVAGVVIRPVDLPAIKRIARATKGAIQIPGIRIKEVQTTVLRT